MKKYIKYKLLIIMCLLFAVFNANAQQVNTMYFMDNVPYRNQLNPAFQPTSNFYLAFPIFGFSQFGVGNNSLTLKDLVYKNQTGLPISFLHPDGNVDKFYNALNSITSLQAYSQLNLLSFGFRTGKSYWNFTINEKQDGELGIPKDFAKLLLYGTTGTTNNFNFKNLGTDFTLYTEVGLGYSRTLSDKWAFGTKFKFLAGTANMSVANNSLDLNASMEQWTLKGGGSMNFTAPGTLTIGNNMENFDYQQPSSKMDFAKPSGMGGAVDFGLTYKPFNCLTLSAAIVDLGFINWNKNVTNATYAVDYAFTGVGSIYLNSKIDGKALVDSITNALKNSKVTSTTNNKYTTHLSPKMNFGAEYGVLDNKLTLGVLLRTIKNNGTFSNDLTGSLNIKPIDWFNISGSYSVFNGKTSNVGAGLGLRTGFLHWFLSADYVPLHYTTSYIPYETKSVNLAFGLSFVFGNRKDHDKDGVVDRKDKCPETPLGVLVDKKGCPIDSDGDGVPDYLDKCPNTPVEAYSYLSSDGCPTDSDGDGVPDYQDSCPNTPIAAYQYIDKNGCPLDTDGDGVPDYLDKCNNSPKGIKVDSVGCSIDTDKDGVPDYIDKCPNTPIEARNMVDSVGCPTDKDLDGVPDYLDLCPNTPAEARLSVDKNGCTLDADGDGVPDYLDKCPNTPLEARSAIDQYGCPRDTDGDGIPDYLDNCPQVPGVVSNHGCPELKTEIKKLFQKALRGIQFETGKYVIKPTSFTILNQIAVVLKENPTYLIEVQGHTDNAGNQEANTKLSASRANAVKEYLTNKGVDANRVTSKGYGDTMPVASNSTAAGKALNRRVEFVVSFEQTVTQ
jgi:outer membrane protein OmpA-like peptidoglycan-associated protein